MTTCASPQRSGGGTLARAAVSSAVPTEALPPRGNNLRELLRLSAKLVFPNLGGADQRVEDIIERHPVEQARRAFPRGRGRDEFVRMLPLPLGQTALAHRPHNNPNLARLSSEWIMWLCCGVVRLAHFPHSEHDTQGECDRHRGDTQRLSPNFWAACRSGEGVLQYGAGIALRIAPWLGSRPAWHEGASRPP